MEILQYCPIYGSDQYDLYISAKDYFLTGESFDIVRCITCGFRFTNPRPVQADLGRYYESPEYISHSDSRKGIFAAVYQQVRKHALRRKYSMISRFQPTGEILDIGCATGQFLNFMAAHGWKTTGIEPDEKTRRYAISEYGLKVLPENKLYTLPKSSFDVITMWHVLEHVSDLKDRMNQLKSLLKPAGTLVIAVPNCESYDAIKYGAFWAGYDLPRHLYHFAKDDMKLLLDSHGFTLVTILPMKFDAFYVSLLSEKYLTGKMRWLPALWNGFWSNRKGSQNGGYSSLIYVIKLK